MRWKCVIGREVTQYNAKIEALTANAAAGVEVFFKLIDIFVEFQWIFQSIYRNKQFRAHLDSEDPTTAAKFVQGLCSVKDDGVVCEDSEVGFWLYKYVKI